MINFQFLKNRGITAGFTLIEMLVYIALVTIIVSVIVAFSFWMIQISAKAKVNSEVLANARRAMEIMTYEIRKSKSVYAPTSVFDKNPGQLGLQQTAAAGSEETTTFADFFICNQALCLKREKTPPIALTGSSVRVTNFLFNRRLNSLNAESIRITLKVESLASNKPEYTNSIELTGAANLRSY
ncbi:MAG: type II secretion system protein [Candidatus Portnoybacteria bacterium]|nr:type II secretion system protein [Candidatus Portnoybacteria bacterium]MDD4982752.1 type II secretion system protein [Candidatus Portnoybacteria bacterium]